MIFKKLDFHISIAIWWHFIACLNFQQIAVVVSIASKSLLQDEVLLYESRTIDFDVEWCKRISSGMTLAIQDAQDYAEGKRLLTSPKKGGISVGSTFLEVRIAVKAEGNCRLIPLVPASLPECMCLGRGKGSWIGGLGICSIACDKDAYYLALRPQNKWGGKRTNETCRSELFLDKKVNLFKEIEWNYFVILREILWSTLKSDLDTVAIGWRLYSELLCRLVW